MKKLVSLILIMMLLCGTALADTGTVITMDTSNVPVIPEGTLSAEVISFTGNHQDHHRPARFQRGARRPHPGAGQRPHQRL